MFFQLETDVKDRILRQRDRILAEGGTLDDYVLEIPLPLEPEYVTVFGFETKVVDKDGVSVVRKQ